MLLNLLQPKDIRAISSLTDRWISSLPVRLPSFLYMQRNLQELLQNSEDPTFSIYADKTVPIEQVVNMMNIGKRNKYKVILATSPE